MNDHPDAPKQFSTRFSEETIEVNKKLLAKIDSDSILKASIVKGSIYFYLNTCGDDSQSKEELIGDPTALDTAIKDFGMEIKYEDKHHRWIAEASHALKILELAAEHLSRSNEVSPNSIGINAELKWQDEEGFENIIHLTQSKGDTDWKVSRFAL